MPNNKASVFGNTNFSWGESMNEEIAAKLASRTPEQIAQDKANSNALEKELEAIRMAKKTAEQANINATAQRIWATENAKERENALSELGVRPRNFRNFAHPPKTAKPIDVAKPRPGKMMRECRTNDVSHKIPSGEQCKFIHKDEPEYAMLRTNQKRAGGKSSRKASRKSKKGGSAGRNIYITPSPAPLSKVNTYTSWPGGIDPSVPLYNQKTMLGGTRKNRK